LSGLEWNSKGAIGKSERYNMGDNAESWDAFKTKTKSLAASQLVIERVAFNR